MNGRQSFAIGDISAGTAADGTRITRPDWAPLLITMAVVSAIGFAVAYHFIWVVGPKVGKEFVSAAPAPAPPPPK